MSEKTKLSIRFFEDLEVRTICDEAQAKWWFSVLDVIAVLNNQDDYIKNRNFWKYLKAKLKNENNELISGTAQLILLARDGKRYLSDILDMKGVLLCQKFNNPSYFGKLTEANPVDPKTPSFNTSSFTKHVYLHSHFTPLVIWNPSFYTLITCSKNTNLGRW